MMTATVMMMTAMVKMMKMKIEDDRADDADENLNQIHLTIDD